MTMCYKHNRYFRAGKCPICIKEMEDSIQNDYEIRMLELELKQPIKSGD